MLNPVNRNFPPARLTAPNPRPTPTLDQLGIAGIDQQAKGVIQAAAKPTQKEEPTTRKVEPAAEASNQLYGQPKQPQRGSLDKLG